MFQIWRNFINLNDLRLKMMLNNIKYKLSVFLNIRYTRIYIYI